LRERLTALELPSYVKTSGGKGFHVVVPMRPGDLNWTDFKRFAKAVAEDMDQLVPDVFVTKMSKAQRTGKIFLDYLRNGRGATSVAAFSVRARAGAPVSMPVSWDALAKLPSADTFTLQNADEWRPSYDPQVWEGYLDFAGRVTDRTWELLNGSER
jgi:bifunctional non-homologous end joining protein LigD